MSDKVIFIEDYDEEYDEEQDDFVDKKIIKVGKEWKCNNGEVIFSEDFWLHPDKKCVRTRCGDSYMDYTISFDKFLQIADKIRELQKEEK